MSPLPLRKWNESVFYAQYKMYKYNQKHLYWPKSFDAFQTNYVQHSFTLLLSAKQSSNNPFLLGWNHTTGSWQASSGGVTPGPGKSMYLLQPDRALHHTISRDDALVKMRTALSVCGYNIILLYYTVYKGFVGFLKIWIESILGWAPAQKLKVETPPLKQRELILWLIALNLLW